MTLDFLNIFYNVKNLIWSNICLNIITVTSGWKMDIADCIMILFQILCVLYLAAYSKHMRQCCRYKMFKNNPSLAKLYRNCYSRYWYISGGEQVITASWDRLAMLRDVETGLTVTTLSGKFLLPSKINSSKPVLETILTIFFF